MGISWGQFVNKFLHFLVLKKYTDLVYLLLKEQDYSLLSVTTHFKFSVNFANCSYIFFTH